jgi:hypothetical protein
LTLLGNVKQIGRFFQNFVAFSEYLNFKKTPSKVSQFNKIAKFQELPKTAISAQKQKGTRLILFHKELGMHKFGCN